VRFLRFSRKRQNKSAPNFGLGENTCSLQLALKSMHSVFKLKKIEKAECLKLQHSQENQEK